MASRQLLLLAGAVLLSGWIALGSLLDPPGWGSRRRLQADLSLLRAANAAAQTRSAAMRDQIRSLRSRPEVQEWVIRQELGFVHPGEIVLRLESEQP